MHLRFHIKFSIHKYQNQIIFSVNSHILKSLFDFPLKIYDSPQVNGGKLPRLSERRRIMKKNITLKFTFLSAALLVLTAAAAFADEDRYKIVIEESFYVVRPENKDKFLEVYREKLYPFWSEMQKMGIIVDEYRLYSQRVHTLEPLWTYKTVVKFKNYQSIDRWLEMRDEVYNKLFPGEGGYKSPRDEIDLITEEHWDEFIREIPLSKN